VLRRRDSGGGESAISGETGLHPSEHQRAEDSAEPEGREQGAVPVGSQPKVPVGDHWQQGPERYSWYDEDDRSQHEASYGGFVPDEAAAGPQGRYEAFSAG
jgi:hypothetical protein